VINPGRLQDLKLRAQHSLHEDADATGACAREELLQLYRQTFFRYYRFDPEAAEGRLPWGHEDVLAVEWLERLSTSGHVGAQHLLEQAMDADSLLNALHGTAPELLQTLAARHASASSYVAKLLCTKENCDLKKVRHWLRTGHNSDRFLASALDELDALGLSLGDEEHQFLRKQLSEPRRWHGLRYARAHVLLAAARHHAGTPAGMRALELAAELGNEEAIDELFRLRSTTTIDKARLLDAWFDAGGQRTHKIRVMCFAVGAEMERRCNSTGPDFARALKYYRIAVGGVIWRKDRSDELDKEFCFDVAHAFDGNSPRCKVADPELAALWHERLNQASRL
jgi:hypothetical protein